MIIEKIELENFMCYAGKSSMEFVEGINVIKKAIKPNTVKSHPQGGIVEITKPIWVSKVAIVEPTSKKPSKIGYAISKDGTKERIYKRSGKVVK